MNWARAQRAEPVADDGWLRRRLLNQLISDRERDRAAAADTARLAGWPMPDTVCVAVVDGPARTRFAGTVLPDLAHPVPRVLVPAPVGREWAEMFDDCRRAIVGPTVLLNEAARSLRQAMEVRELVVAGLLPGAQLMWCEDHLRALLLMRNRGLVKQLADRTLAPLEALDRKKRARARSTLLAWLQARGNLAEVAELLRLHPQTIRYRMKELNRLFGDRLDDPGFRFDLELVLRALNAVYAGYTEHDALPRLERLLRKRGIRDLSDRP